MLGIALRVEERGLSVSWSALRVSYAMGGDGESNIRADLRHLAAFVRDPCTVVSCVLLPFSCSMQMEMQVLLPPTEAALASTDPSNEACV